MRLGVLQGFLTLHRCNVRNVEVRNASSALGHRPDVVFVSGEIPGGASFSLLDRARSDAPDALLVGLISTEKQRTAMIRAGADYALRVPSDMPHLVERLEEVRRGAFDDGASTVSSSDEIPPPPPPTGLRREPSPAEIEAFMGEAPELIADICDALAKRQIPAVNQACERLQDRALEFDCPELARPANICAAFAETGDFRTATGFADELEDVYASVFRKLMHRLA